MRTQYAADQNHLKRELAETYTNRCCGLTLRQDVADLEVTALVTAGTTS